MSLPEPLKFEKYCPDGHPMVIRVNRETGQEFLGCSQWNACTYTEKLPEYIRLRIAGHKPLPGFE